MLNNELKEIESLLLNLAGEFNINYSELHLKHQIQQVQEAWLNAVFSELPKTSLERYLQFHLEGIARISDTLFGLNLHDDKILHDGLLILIDHLYEYYNQLLNKDCNAPVAYHQRLIRKLDPALSGIRSMLKNARIPPLLTRSVEAWLDEISVIQPNVRFTFRSLAYMEKLVSILAKSTFEEDVSATLAQVLYQANFNHLTFLKFLQDEITESAEQITPRNGLTSYLQAKLGELMSIPLECNVAYDPSWPSIKVMVTDWLKEQIRLSEYEEEKEQENLKSLFALKLGLNVSVPHIACLIRLFYKAELFATENLRSIFKFYAANYESKKQTAISWESLSKEYYSLNSNTAARIKRILQGMLDNLNRDFFPVLAVISVGLGIYSGNQ